MFKAREKEVTPIEWGDTDEQQPQHTNSFYYLWQLTAAGKVFGT